jgi:hypothetical protein
MNPWWTRTYPLCLKSHYTYIYRARACINKTSTYQATNRFSPTVHTQQTIFMSPPKNKKKKNILLFRRKSYTNIYFFS